MYIDRGIYRMFGPVTSNSVPMQLKTVYKFQSLIKSSSEIKEYIVHSYFINNKGFLVHLVFRCIWFLSGAFCQIKFSHLPHHLRVPVSAAKRSYKTI